MASKKRSSKHSAGAEKEIWHRLDLQKLRHDRFAYVANQILQGKFTLIKLNSSPFYLAGAVHK